MPLRQFMSVLLLTLSIAVSQVAEAPCAQAPSALTLEEAQQLALEHNQLMRAQRLNTDQAKANEITAALKPNPVFTSTNEDFPIFSPGDLTVENIETNQEFLASVTYLFERGGKRQKRIAVAEDTTDVTTKTVIEAERQLRFQVAQAFISTLLAKSNLQFSKEALENFSKVVDINKSRLSAGDISEADYLKVALQKLQFEQDVAAANIFLIRSKQTLRQIVGFDTIPEDFDIHGELKHNKYSVTQDDLERQALLARPDFQAAQSAVKLANSTVELAYGNRTRDISGEWEYKRNGAVNGVGFGLSIEIPIHNRNQGEIARSKVAVRQALETAEATRFGVLTDVRSALAGFNTSDQVVSVFESGYLDQSTRSREISNYAYLQGGVTLLDLLDAERSYRTTQLSYRQALAAFMISVEQINFAVGRQVMQ